MNNNLISIIIPCFNSERTIERAIFSIEKQTYKDIEVICIDDGSTDQTVNILERLSKKLGFLTILKNANNSGPSYSRNRGVSISQGEYIAFLDSDDYWHPQKLELQLQSINKYKYSFIATAAEPNLDTDFIVEAHNVEIEHISFKKLLFKNFFSTPSVLMRKEIFLPFDETQKFSEDYKLWLEISSNSLNKMGLIKSPPLVGLDKFNYGVSGLSNNLWLMEKYEIKNYLFFLKKGYLLPLLAIPLSLIKYFKRLCLTFLRKK